VVASYVQHLLFIIAINHNKVLVECRLVVNYTKATTHAHAMLSRRYLMKPNAPVPPNANLKPVRFGLL